MEKGNIVTFKNEPTANTPGRPNSPYACTGVVVKDGAPLNVEPIEIDPSKWCEVLWSNNQITRCYKPDLRVWK